MGHEPNPRINESNQLPMTDQFSNPPIHQSINDLSTYLSVCLSVCPSVRLCFYLYISEGGWGAWLRRRTKKATSGNCGSSHQTTHSCPCSTWECPWGKYKKRNTYKQTESDSNPAVIDYEIRLPLESAHFEGTLFGCLTLRKTKQTNTTQYNTKKELVNRVHLTLICHVCYVTNNLLFNPSNHQPPNPG